jgi:hypothetical protein
MSGFTAWVSAFSAPATLLHLAAEAEWLTRAGDPNLREGTIPIAGLYDSTEALCPPAEPDRHPDLPLPPCATAG